ncbi:MAG: hypothetical protein N3F04_06175 [Candidatus Nezhaarchaeota archaeon]|nr:hypothetical protein [Candidatus Nezhaarchaeota archaeon]MCX8142327.1 hypothetical protein [Candidatus Nezhaarchaeota archaeon]MDW8050700.1 hypothetical protein [Nitrososphaerota archaeon]
MALKYCPGARGLVEPQIIVTYCPVCGAEVEFFEYEVERKCPECGRVVKREATPSCVTWCKSARECIMNLQQLGKLSAERARELLEMLDKTKKSSTE